MPTLQGFQYDNIIHMSVKRSLLHFGNILNTFFSFSFKNVKGVFCLPAIAGFFFFLAFTYFVLWVVERRPVNIDQLESLYASWKIFTGDFPYRDFYQLHTPLAYYLLFPLFYLFHTFAVFHAAQGVMVCFYLINAYLIFLLGRRLFSARAGGAAVFLYLTSWPVMARMTEFRPDAWMVIFCNLALLILLHGERNRSLSFWASGVCTGLAILSKQSGCIFFLAVIVFFLFRCGTRRILSWDHVLFDQAHFNRRTLLFYTLGTAFVLLSFMIFLKTNHGLVSFLNQGVSNDFLRRIFLQKTEAVHWLPWKYLKETFLISPLPFCFVTISWVFLLRNFRESPAFNAQLFINSLLFICIASLFFILHPWLQELLLPSQYIALLGGSALAKIWPNSPFRIMPKTQRALFGILLISLTVSSFSFIQKTAQMAVTAQKGFLDHTPELLSHQSNMVLSLTRPTDKCVSLDYPCLFRPSIYFYNQSSTSGFFESISGRKRFENALLTDLRKGEIKLLIHSDCLERPGPVIQELQRFYTRLGDFYFPGSKFDLIPNQTSPIEIRVAGWYQIQFEPGPLKLDNRPLEIKKAYLSKGTHTFQSAYAGSVTFLYDYQSNKDQKKL